MQRLRRRRATATMTPERYRFTIVDVFAESTGGGNPLAVVDDASGLDAQSMQRIAREFNFSESTFVLPGTEDAGFTVRIFTPTREVPFAGHPNVGTAWVLRAHGRLTGETARFAEAAGIVEVSWDEAVTDGPVWIRAPGALNVGESCAAELVAAALSLPVAAIAGAVHEASVGLPFTLVPLADEETLSRAEVDHAALKRLVDAGINPDLHCFVREGQQLATRMFAPLDGVPEDPATGSANCALAAVLATAAGDGDAEWEVTQGVAMGRPSRLTIRTTVRDGALADVWLAGRCRMFATGELVAG